MNSLYNRLLFQIAAAIATGALLRFVVGLRPIWWLVWFAPVPLLLMAFRFSSSETRWDVTLAAVIGTSSNFRYFRLVMPLPAVIAVIAAQTLLWGFLTIATRRLVVRYQAWWMPGLRLAPLLCAALKMAMPSSAPPERVWSPSAMPTAGSWRTVRAAPCPAVRSSQK